jgi:hypothetical protein
MLLGSIYEYEREHGSIIKGMFSRKIIFYSI